MRLVYRLLIFSLALVTIMIVFVMAIVDMRLRDRMVSERAAELGREAELIGGNWAAGTSPKEIADRSSKALNGRVSLIDQNGVIVADAATGGLNTRSTGEHATRPEVLQAKSGQTGIAIDTNDADESPDLYVAVNTPKGIVRVGVEMSSLDRIFDQARQDVAAAGFVALSGPRSSRWCSLATYPNQ